MRKVSTLTSALIKGLRRLDSSTVANAVETFEVRLPNTGFADSRIHCLFPDFPPMVGYAATARIRTADPPMEGHTYIERKDWLSHILAIPEPRVVVLEDMDNPRTWRIHRGDACEYPPHTGLRGSSDQRWRAWPSHKPRARNAVVHRKFNRLACIRPHPRFRVPRDSGTHGRTTGRHTTRRPPRSADRTVRDRGQDPRRGKADQPVQTAHREALQFGDFHSRSISRRRKGRKAINPAENCPRLARRSYDHFHRNVHQP